MIWIILYSIAGLYATFFLLLAYGFIRVWDAGRRSINSDSSSDFPFISVVIPCRNDNESLILLLEQISRQSFDPSRLEVIIVDDHSDVPVLNSIRNTPSPFPFPVICIRPEGISGKKGALEAGIIAASHPIILVTDADCFPDKNWISSTASCFGTTKKVFVAGMVKMNAPSRSRWFSGPEILDFYGLTASAAGAAGLGMPFICNGASMAFTKEAYIKVKGMEGHNHLSSGDDVFLLHKMIRMFGGRSICWNLSSGSSVVTASSATLKALMRQRIRWASKSSRYRNPSSVFVASLVLMTCLAVVAGFFMAIAEANITGFLIIIGLKAAADLPLLYLQLAFHRQRNLLWWFLPVTILYPFYTGVTGILSFFIKPDWKGRRIR
jgi:poly-beta-1,6-N-acetyl-D-glucosamine synthase